MSVIHAPEERPLTLRQLLVLGTLFVCLLIFAVRLWFLQVHLTDTLAEKAVKTSVRVVKTQAPRGRIFDRHGALIAGVQPTWVVKATPAEVTDESVLKVSQILQVEERKIRKALEDAPFRSLPWDVYLGATFVQASRIAESRSLLPGFDVDMTAIRSVNEPYAYSHILGHVGKVTKEIKEELKKEGIEAVEYVGRDGVERTHERELMGVPGEDRMAVDARARPLSLVGQKEPVPGSRLYLSIDDSLQREAMKALEGRKGGLAMLDVRTGEVLAFVSAPSFNLELFEGGIDEKNYQNLLNDPRKPLIRRPTSGRYSPGSTFKVVTALAAAREGLLDLNHTVYCAGGKRVGRRLVACRNHASGMTLAFNEAFRRSCNSYFVELALKAGPEAMHKAALDLGLGTRTGIDLPSESRGVIPSGKNVREARGERPWYPGDTANFGIGQGDTLVTPLQMAQLAAAVSMEGVAYRPRLVHAVQRPDEDQPRLFPPVEAFKAEAPPGFWETIRRAMGSVVATGTAKRAQIPGLIWGGKTGSTQHSRGGKTHSWFMGVAPLDNPRVAIAVLAEEAGHGGDVSAPIAARVVGLWHQREAERTRSKPASIASIDSRRS